MDIPLATDYDCSDGEHHFHHYAGLHDRNSEMHLKRRCPKNCMIDSFRQQQPAFIYRPATQFQRVFSNPDGTIKLRNPQIYTMSDDFLYHLGLGKSSHDLVEMFGDVKVRNNCKFVFAKPQLRPFQFVCTGGTPKRMKEFALYLMKELNHKLPTGTELSDIAAQGLRYSMYKVGPVLSVSVSENLGEFQGFLFLTVKVKVLCQLIVNLRFAKWFCR